MLNKDDRAVEMQARIQAPLEWYSHQLYKIQDLKEQRFDEVLRLIKHYHFREEPMCMALDISQDKESTKKYLELLKIVLKDTMSLVALSSTTGRVIGTAITRIDSDSHRSITYTRIQVIKGKILQKILGLMLAVLEQSNAYKEFGQDKYLRIYVLCVHPSYRRKGVGTALVRACMDAARPMQLSAIGGIFSSQSSQELALKLGFKMFTEIPFSQWIVNDIVVFDDPGRGNYSVAFMGILLEDKEKQDLTADKKDST